MHCASSYSALDGDGCGASAAAMVKGAREQQARIEIAGNKKARNSAKEKKGNLVRLSGHCRCECVSICYSRCEL